MYTTFHYRTSEEKHSDVLKAIKSAFKSKPVTINVEEDKNPLYPTNDGMLTKNNFQTYFEQNTAIK